MPLRCLPNPVLLSWTLSLIGLIQVLMALSNGYTSTLAMIYGPQQVNPEGPDAETAGSIMILALTFGLCSGAGLSYLMVAVATGF